MAALLGAMAELGYGVAYRMLDSRYLGVPQRRRRVFIVGLRSGRDDPDGHLAAERAAEVLAVGSRCRRHPPTGSKPGKDATERFADGVGGAGILPQSVNAKWVKQSSGPSGDEHHHLVLRPPDDPGRDGAPDGATGRLDDRAGLEPAWSFDPTTSLDQAPHPTLAPPLKQGSGVGIGWAPGVLQPHLAPTLRVGAQRNDAGGPGDTVPVVVQSLDTKRGGADDNEAQAGHLIAYMPHRTLQTDGSVLEGFAPRPVSDALHGPTGNKEPLMVGTFSVDDDPLLPPGLDSNRYRACGNAVVATVAEWIGHHLRAELEPL